MSEPKAKPTDQDPQDFLNLIGPEQKRKEAFVLLEIFEKATGDKGIMWGSSIVGFGKYHYKSEHSHQEGDWPLVGFSPRKQNLSLYVLMGRKDQDNYRDLLTKLGKYKTSVACLYINKLADIDLDVLSHLVKKCYINNKKMLGKSEKMDGLTKYS